MAISQAVLRSKSVDYYLTKEARLAVAEGLALGLKMAFLCHSHKDQDMVMGLIVLFRELGVSLYVDWKDASMPESPNSETARRIQRRIAESDVFLYLATVNSRSSTWCPWEIGYADASNKKIYVIPTTDGYNSYGSEYLDLYPRIDKGIYRVDGRPGYFVHRPGLSTGYAVSDGELI